MLGTRLISVNLLNGTSENVKAAMTIPGGAGGVNAMAYHSGEDYLYAIAQTSGQKGYVVRISSDGLVERPLPGDVRIDETTSSIVSGTIDPQGFFWISWTQGQQFAKIDMNFGSVNYSKVVDSGPTGLTTQIPGNQGSSYVISDWAYLGGIPPGRIYAVAGQTVNSTLGIYKSHLVYWTTANKTWSSPTTYEGLAGGTGPAFGANPGTGKAEWGAMYATSDGFLYATENNSGRIYRFNVANRNATNFESLTQGPQGGSNDGARCYSALGP